MLGIIGNKSELEGQRQVSIKEGQNFANFIKEMFMDAFVFFEEISIKTGKNMNNLLLNLYAFEI